MSRARAAAERVPDDAYMTPAPLAGAICAWVARRVSAVEVIEPSAGAGAFVRAARGAWPRAHVTANELDRRRGRALAAAGAHQVEHEDWLAFARRLAPAAGPRVIIGNPPYRLAQEHVEAGLGALGTDDALAFLLRINFLGAAERIAFWRARPASVVVPIAPRPSFTGGGTDGTEYAVFFWKGGKRGRAARLAPPLVWREG